MTKLLIARHGNTFDKGDTILRVGKGTDLPLSESGQVQAQALGDYLQQQHPDISQVFVSTLQRTQQTAQIALQTFVNKPNTNINPVFDEIDYGPDEGKPETEVVARVGQSALDLWDEKAIVPTGWQVSPEQIKQQWIDFTKQIQQDFAGQTILVVTSNGVARFAGFALKNPDEFYSQQTIKLSTGAVSCFSYQNGWNCDYWNLRPNQMHR